MLCTFPNRLQHAGHSCQINTEDVESDDGLKKERRRFSLGPQFAMQSMSFWRKHIYFNMCHVYSSERGSIAGISTLDAEDELVVLELMHCQSGDENNYTELMEFFKNSYPTMSSCEVIAVLSNGDKGLAPAVKNCLPNAVEMLCLFHILKNVSSNKYDPGRLQLEQTAYRPNERELIKELNELSKHEDAFNRVKDLDTTTWTLNAAPKEVFGRLSSQLAEVFNSLLKSSGIRNCSPLKMIQIFLSWYDRRIVEKKKRADDLIKNGRIAVKCVHDKMKLALERQPGLSVSESDILCDESRVSGKVSYYVMGKRSTTM